MLSRGQIESTVESVLYNKITNENDTELVLTIKTNSSELHVFFDKKQDAFNKEFQKYHTGDRVILFYPDTSILQKPSINCPKTKIKYSKAVKISKDCFKNISDLKIDKYSDIIAMCYNYKSLITTKGTDSVFSLNLKDQSGYIELKVFTNTKEFAGFVIEFNSEEPFKVGDILLIRNVKRSTKSDVAIVFKPCSIVKIQNFADLSIPETFVEHAIAQFLINKVKPVQTIKNEALGKTLQIKDLNDQRFFNIVGKVLNCEHDAVPSICITDFTVNEDVTECSNTFPNSMVLAIKLFGQHSYLTEKITVGGYYNFINIRVKSFSPIITAYMHDSLQGDIFPVTEGHALLELKEREAQYNKNKDLYNGIIDNKKRQFDITNAPLGQDIDKNNEEEKKSDCKQSYINKHPFDEHIHNHNRNYISDTKVSRNRNGTTITEYNTNYIENDVYLDSDDYNDLINTNNHGRIVVTANKLLNDVLKQHESERNNMLSINKNRNDNLPKTMNIKTPVPIIYKNMGFAKLKDMAVPGIYLSFCYISKITHNTPFKQKSSILIVIEGGKQHFVKTKRVLTDKIIKESAICANKHFKCLVMLLGTGDLYMIDVFKDDNQYHSFVDYYLDALKQ